MYDCKGTPDLCGPRHAKNVACGVLMGTAMATTKPTAKAKRKTHRSPPKKVSKRDAQKDLLARRNAYAAKFFPYIEKVARRLARRLPAHVEIDDLISSGVIGLMEAAERFDPERVDRFEAFAEFRIRGAMLDDLRSRDTLSRDMRRLSNELRDATRKLEAQLGRTPDHEEVAKRLGVGVDELYARQQKLSGSSVVGIDDAGPDLLERTGDQSAEDPFEIASRREMMQRLVSGIGDLPEKMQQVLSLYYCDNLNLKEIGAVLGVTESRVCQIHGEATRRLRDNLGELAAEAAA
jgi:RNA polymerase sigma factor for flagellar operon FliA